MHILVLQDIPNFIHKFLSLFCKSGLKILFGLKYSALMNLNGLMTVTNIFVDDPSFENGFFLWIKSTIFITNICICILPMWYVFGLCVDVFKLMHVLKRYRWEESEKRRAKLVNIIPKSPYPNVVTFKHCEYVINCESKWSLPFISSHLLLRFLVTYLN